MKSGKFNFAAFCTVSVIALSGCDNINKTDNDVTPNNSSASNARFGVAQGVIDIDRVQSQDYVTSGVLLQRI